MRTYETVSAAGLTLVKNANSSLGSCHQSNTMVATKPGQRNCDPVRGGHPCPPTSGLLLWSLEKALMETIIFEIFRCTSSPAISLLRHSRRRFRKWLSILLLF